MKVSLLTALTAVAAVSTTAHAKSWNHDKYYKRQSASAAGSAATATATASGTATAAAATATIGTSIPALAQITSGMPTQATVALSTTYTAGATPPVKGAPVLPTVSLTASAYPTPGVTPPTDSDEVKAWIAAIDWSTIPDIPTNTWTSGDLCTEPANLAAVKNASASGTCWWTCGQCNRDVTAGGTDITTCPTKGEWGLTFDDGPSDYTPLIVNQLAELQLSATFFVIGTSALYRPSIVQAEYMAGHQICDHTWSHSVGLTSLTNEQIVAELGWGRKILQDLLGITVLYMRPPWGDTDDRVRAICKAMNLTPIIWTSVGTFQYDTDDWNIPAGTSNATHSFALFESFVANSTSLDTGFITLEHDLYQAEVDLGVGYIIPYAVNSTNPKLDIKNVIACQGKTIEDAYAETATNLTNTNGANGTSTNTTTGASGTTTSSAGVGAASASSTRTGGAGKIGATVGALVGAALAVVLL